MTYNYTRANTVEGGGINPNDSSDNDNDGVEVTWASIRVTTMFSLLQGLILFLFFLIQRYRERNKGYYTLYETRQYTRKHRSPLPYGGATNSGSTSNNRKDSTNNNANSLDKKDEVIARGDEDNSNDDNNNNAIMKEYGMGPFGWAIAAYEISNEKLLECVGADTFMYLRFLRLGFRITCFGSILALVLLLPVYATGKGTGANTREFNQFTLAKVLPNSPRLYASVIAWFIFVGFVLYEFWYEWTVYRNVRRQFYLNGDNDTPDDFRYTIMLEEVPIELRSSHMLIQYFNNIFPGKVRQACVCYKTDHLNKLMNEREQYLVMYEQADAYCHAKPTKPKPTKRIDSKCCCVGGKIVDTMSYAKDEIKWLNDAIDQERTTIHRFADECNHTNMLKFRNDEKTNISNHLVTSTLDVFVQAVPLPKIGQVTSSSNSLHESLAVENNKKGKNDDNNNNIKDNSNAKDNNNSNNNNEVPLVDSIQSSYSLYETDKSEGDNNERMIPGSPKSARSSLDEYAKAFQGVPVQHKEPSQDVTMEESQKQQQQQDEREGPTSSTMVTRTSVENLSTSTAFVTFTSIVTTNSVMQCNISEKPGNLVAFRSPDPNGIIWNNIPFPLKLEKIRQLWASILWTLGVLFWTIPVAFVTSLANLSTILQALQIHNVNTDSFLYGLASGLLPVLALNILTAMVPIVIQLCAMKYIRFKRLPQVDNYVYFWHQLYQFANLWLIIIGGSIYSQVNKIFNGVSGVTEIIEDVAKAMAGQSVFFVDMIVWGSFAQFGMELSMVSTYGIQLLTTLIQPESIRTQRTIDESHKSPIKKWGYDLPPIMFVFLVSLVYMPIVPMIELFAAVYFGGMYIVWKHQCLHVYAQKAEGGGLIWERLFTFLLGCLYTSEACFIAYMGIKQAPIPSVLGFIPLGITFIFEKLLTKQIIEPVRTLALEIAGRIDREEGERLPSTNDNNENQEQHFADVIEQQVYGQPVLKRSNDEREPLPYRRINNDEEVTNQLNSDSSNRHRRKRSSSSKCSGVDERHFFDCEEDV